MGAVLVGVALRAYQLPGQLLVGDEWHALRKVASSSYTEIFTSFGDSDHTIPIALYYELASHSIGLSEWVIRAPFFIAGVLTVLVVPLLLRHRVGRPTTNVLAWLLALSPLLVYYSRFARPYSISVFFSLVAVLAFEAWWLKHQTRDAVLYAILTVLTGYLSLVALPFVLGPFAFFFATTLRGPAMKRWPSVKRLVWLGLGTVGPLLVLIAPPVFMDSQALAIKAGRGTIEFDTVLRTLQSMAGAGGSWVAAGVAMLAGIGWLRMSRTTPRFWAFLTVLALIQMIAVAVASPLGVERVTVLCRYLLPGLPVLLLFAAAGLIWIADCVAGFSNKCLAIAVVVGVCAALFVSGPFPHVFYRPNNWTANVLRASLENKPDPLRFLRRKLRPVPEFYRSLSRLPPASRVVVEAPWPWTSGRNHLPVYQHIHRQETRIGFVNGLCSEPWPGELPWGTPGIRLRNFVFLADPDGLREQGIDYVVFHRNLMRETRRKPIPGRETADVSACIAKYRTRIGPPIFSDSDIVVFEIADQSQTATPVNAPW